MKMTEQQIKYMRDRFLSWTLPKNLNPDGGISYRRSESAIKYNHPGPIGTNFLDAEQAEAMVRHMVEGLPGVSVTRDGMTDREKLIREEFCFDSDRDCEAVCYLIGVIDTIRWDRKLLRDRLDSNEQTIRQLRERNAELIHADCRGCEALKADLQQLQAHKERLHKEIEIDPAEIEWIREVQRNYVHAIAGGGTGWGSMLWKALTMMLERLDTLRAATDDAAIGVQLAKEGTDG